MTGRMDFDVINPATGEVVGTAPRCTQEICGRTTATTWTRPWPGSRTTLQP
jgi:acyl-CoA reductase-like NAD-dependent aldehyde dehydrogenase